MPNQCAHEQPPPEPHTDKPPPEQPPPDQPTPHAMPQSRSPHHKIISPFWPLLLKSWQLNARSVDLCTFDYASSSPGLSTKYYGMLNV
jgi:hypothetical protein